MTTRDAPARTTLAGLVGAWEGTVRTWFEPGDPGVEAPIRARIRTVVPPDADDPGSGFVLYEYTSEMRGEPFEGVAILGTDGASGAPVCAWVDGFHMSNAVMLSKGAVPAPSRVERATRAGASGGAVGTGGARPAANPGDVSVLGQYADPTGGPDWGWRTVFHLADPDHLVVTAYNIPPPGVVSGAAGEAVELKAVEASYTRRRESVS